MAKIDRSEQEKTVKIGPWKVKLGTICIIGLVVIMMGSSLGYVATKLGNPEPPPKEQTDQIQAQIVISFDANNTFEEVVPLKKGENIEIALKKIADVKTKDLELGKVLQAITYSNWTAENAQDKTWAMYINGRQDLRGIDKYEVQQGDLISFKYETNPFS